MTEAALAKVNIEDTHTPVLIKLEFSTDLPVSGQVSLIYIVLGPEEEEEEDDEEEGGGRRGGRGGTAAGAAAVRH